MSPLLVLWMEPPGEPPPEGARRGEVVGTAERGGEARRGREGLSDVRRSWAETAEEGKERRRCPGRDGPG